MIDGDISSFSIHVYTHRERQLMWVLGDHTRGLQPGSFYASLIQAALNADDGNLARIGLGFLDVEMAVRDWRASADGWGIASWLNRPRVS